MTYAELMKKVEETVEICLGAYLDNAKAKPAVLQDTAIAVLETLRQCKALIAEDVETTLSSR